MIVLTKVALNHSDKEHTFSILDCSVAFVCVYIRLRHVLIFFNHLPEIHRDLQSILNEQDPVLLQAMPTGSARLQVRHSPNFSLSFSHQQLIHHSLFLRLLLCV